MRNDQCVPARAALAAAPAVEPAPGFRVRGPVLPGAGSLIAGFGVNFNTLGAWKRKFTQSALCGFV